MIRRRTDNGIITLAAVFSVIFIIIIGKYFTLAADPRYANAAVEQSSFTVSAGNSEGNIYDRNMKLLVNSETEYIAVAVPQAIDRNAIAQYAEDPAEFYENYDKGAPFIFKSRKYIEESEGLTVFRIPVRYSEDQLAQHVIGYTSQGVGIAGIEAAYDKLLRGNFGENSVTYSADGFGRVLIGGEKTVNKSGIICSGVVTTLDSDIQRICENAGKMIEKGAIVVTEAETGDILALASFPDYSVYNIEEAVKDEDSPMINRALYSYSVGSIFKLVTACAAIQEDFTGYMYECTGSIDVNGKTFRCHKLNGHGMQTMTDAIVNSCNTYFINLSRLLNVQNIRDTAFTLGFGREIHLCSGITSSAGVLPTVNELLVPAELANFSFGQGKLTATPLQISQLTCAIANDGKMPVLRLIKGITENGVSVGNEKAPQYAYTMEESVAQQLRQMMTAAVNDNEDSNAKPLYVTAGAKTSTAQTGQFDEEGNEIYNAWITGFFPANDPQYAVTVLVENGGYGNDSAAPIFREIADKITKMKEKD